MTMQQLRHLERVTTVWFVASGLSVLTTAFFFGTAWAMRTLDSFITIGAAFLLEATCFFAIIGSMFFLRDLRRARHEVEQASRWVRSGGTLEVPDEAHQRGQ